MSAFCQHKMTLLICIIVSGWLGWFVSRASCSKAGIKVPMLLAGIVEESTRLVVKVKTVD